MIRRALVATTLLLASPAFAAPAPHMPITSFEQLAKPLPLPYDEQADAKATVVAAKARAKANHKLLLIDLGGNWCLDCRILAGTMDVPYFEVGGADVWGATAMVLSELLAAIDGLA